MYDTVFPFGPVRVDTIAGLTGWSKRRKSSASWAGGMAESAGKYGAKVRIYGDFGSAQECAAFQRMLLPYPGPSPLKRAVIVIRNDVGPALDERDGTRVPQSAEFSRASRLRHELDHRDCTRC